MKIRFTGHTRPPARDIIIAVLAILLIVTTGVVVNYWYGSRDDGIAGPGCTWGDEHCDVVDYVHNCENADPTPDQWARYCLPVAYSGVNGHPPWDELTALSDNCALPENDRELLKAVTKANRDLRQRVWELGGNAR